MPPADLREGKYVGRGEQPITRLTLKNRGAAGRDPQSRDQDVTETGVFGAGVRPTKCFDTHRVFNTEKALATARCERWAPQEWQRGSRVGTIPVFIGLSNVKGREITVGS